MSNAKRLRNLEWGKDMSPEQVFASWRSELVASLSEVVSEDRMRPEFEESIMDNGLKMD